MTLLLRYLCDDNDANTVVADSSGNANNAALVSDTTPPNTSGTGISVAGPGNNLTSALYLQSRTSDYFLQATTNVTSYPFTIGGFSNANPPSARTLVCATNQASGTASTCFCLSEADLVDADSVSDFKVTRANANTTVQSLASGHTEFNNLWVHWVVIFVNETSFKVWQNGVLVSDVTGAASRTLSAQVNFFAGAAGPNRDIPTDMTVADLRLYDEAISEATIKAWYAEGFTGVQAAITSPANAANIDHPSGDTGTVLTVVGSGTEADGVTLNGVYTVTGTDAAAFNINPSTGVLTFAATPDYANPVDANTDNVYSITLNEIHPAGDSSVNVTVTVTSVGPPVNTVAPVISKVA